jgi:predicted dehydrogenase
MSDSTRGSGSPFRRRLFLKGSAAASLMWTARSYARVLGANERIRVGFIGAGGMGTNHLKAIHDLKEPNNLDAVAVADCWKQRAEVGAALVGAPQSLVDYRKLLELKEIDYVTIATPEHWHAKMTIDALDAGKAVYCEKPLTHNIEEALQVLKRQQECKLPLQVGVQSTSDDCYARAGEAIRQGLLGKIVQAQIEYVRRYDKQGPFRLPEVTDDTPQPSDLDWNAWLGDAPKTPWNPHHYYEWRAYSAYSGGIATDLFIHRLTRMLIACNLDYPSRVVGMGGIWQWPDGRDFPDNFEMICEYPEGMTVYVLGTMSNRTKLDHVIRGYRGTLQFTGTGWIALDKDGKTLDEYQGDVRESVHKHHTNLHNHLRNGEKLNCPIELGVAGVVTVNMANQSWRSGQMMSWLADKQHVVASHTLAEGGRTAIRPE